LVEYGPETNDTRQRLLAYVKRAVDGTWRAGSQPLIDDIEAARILTDVGASLRSIKPPDAERAELRAMALERFQKVLEQRWTLVEQSEGTIPAPLIIVVGVWLVLIFASFGYRAPRNIIVVTALLVAAALVSAAIYLIIDMDVPFSGPIHVSPAPLERVIAEMQR